MRSRRCGRLGGPRCEKGNPAARRVRKATDLSEVAGLPNGGEYMNRYAPDASVAPPNRMDAEPDQVHPEPDESQPEANRSAPSGSPGPLVALLRVFVLAGENLAGVTRSRSAVRWTITVVAFSILLVVAGNAYASPDKDSDGIHNGRDICLKVANPNQIDQDDDGRGDVCDSDRDGDGVANTSDWCPEEPGSASNGGCPLPPPPTTCSDGQYLAEYRNEAQDFTTAPELTRCENAPLNHEWGTGSPGAGVSADNFTARYKGAFTFESGDYEFTATTDDGLRVIVDGVTIIDEWRPQSATTYTATHNFSAGTHTVVVEYFEATESATAKVSWRELGAPPLDTDGDGVIDDVDQCDNEPGPDSNNGCPVTQPPGSGLCADAIDNDGDKKIDLGDPGCADAADNDESNPASPPIPAGETAGFVSGNTAANAATNRQALLNLANTSRNVTLPPGQYYVDQAPTKAHITVDNYSGTFAMQEGAQIHYLYPAGGGIKWRGGTGAKLINWESFHGGTVRDPLDSALDFEATTNLTIDSATVHGAGGAGILIWDNTNSTIINSHAENTKADGMHIVATDATVRDWSAFNTGDDGLSFQTYTGQYPVASGTADGVTSIQSHARGITVLGSQNVTISNFVVRASRTSGLYIECNDPLYNDCVNKPVKNVLFEHGKVYDAGRHPTGTGPNPDSITVWRSPIDNIVFSDIESHTPVRDCYRGFDGGSATLTNVWGDGAGC
jgi:hypothetical protein